jgi:hypothetical protein
MDDHRPMDNIPLGFDLPQEDEIATNVMSRGTSPYMALFFMQQELEFRPFYSFDATKMVIMTNIWNQVSWRWHENRDGIVSVPPTEINCQRRTTPTIIIIRIIINTNKPKTATTLEKSRPHSTNTIVTTFVSGSTVHLYPSASL